jgi:hypothetical protein
MMPFVLFFAAICSAVWWCAVLCCTALCCTVLCSGVCVALSCYGCNRATVVTCSTDTCQLASWNFTATSAPDLLAYRQYAVAEPQAEVLR